MVKTHSTLLSETAMVRRMSFVSLVGNSVLATFKFFAGIWGHSHAMISDAVHSLSDVFSTFIAIIGVKMANKKADKTHPYGYDRLECVASLLLCAILFMVGCMIGYSGLKNIITIKDTPLVIPSTLALIASIVSIIVKEAMFHYTKYYAQIMNSSVFMADAWHHRSDALSSVGALIGIGGSMLGFPLLEPLASICICVCIIKAAIDIGQDALTKLLDTSCQEDFENQIAEFILLQEGVLGLDVLHTRMFGNKVYVDAEIAVDGNQTLNYAHAIAHHVHDGVEEKFECVKHIMIHINPAKSLPSCPIRDVS